MHQPGAALLLVAWVAVAGHFFAAPARGDGLVRPPRNYQGSLEERAQEAIIVFEPGAGPATGMEDLVLKIQVAGEATDFAWIVPFPHEPKIAKEDPKLFAELFRYVERRIDWGRKATADRAAGDASKSAEHTPAVEVLSRQVVGNFDVAVVREHEAGGLNPWLEKEGYQTLDQADDLLAFYRGKQYVFACIKVTRAAAEGAAFESHPLRFTFATGGDDGLYFPMKLTGLQTQPFDVNLYVFYRAWLNDQLNQFGYEHRGFHLRFRDFDSPQCEANAGKQWSLPAADAYLKNFAAGLETTAAFFQSHHPGRRYYLTNIQARGLQPRDVRNWSDDLWLFPYYTQKGMVPFDVRGAGPAATAWPGLPAEGEGSPPASDAAPLDQTLSLALIAFLAFDMLVVAAVVVMIVRRNRARLTGSAP